MSYLVDSSVWLEMLLGQERADSARRFLLRLSTQELAVTEFSLYSIGLALTRLGQGEIFRQFITDILISAQIRRLVLSADELRDIPEVMRHFRLDFDDAYQYVAAQKHDLTIVSFDADFDRTERGRKTPEQILQELAP
uniref:Ribonuclease VapC n=2 Tax=Candidatus Bipolaricaulota TaxID=67810 RepID=H5SNF9_9BACT|nr:PilT domain protein [uncultured Acetothermia bacterium]BAL59379.1 PilT domain protein [Candidatus Acetothermum autotrophicum]